MNTMRVAVAGLVHDHVWGMLPQFAKVRGVRLVGAADPNRPLREKFRKETGVGVLFPSWRKMLEDVEADAVLVCGTNAGSVPVVEAALARGLHVMMEKPMAATAEGARRIMAALRRNRKARLMVNWPLAWSPAFQRAVEVVQSGGIGHVFHARIHMAHQGPKEAGCSKYFWGWLYDAKENGAGALVDYCCYGAAVMATLWGKPKEVVGVARRLVKKLPVDDNAMIVGIWPERTVLAQASWTQNPDYHDAVFLGLEGTLETSHGTLYRTHTPRKDWSHWGADRSLKREALKVPTPPAGLRNGPEHFVHALRAGEPFMPLCRAETGLIAQEILSAGLKSEQTGRRQRL